MSKLCSILAAFAFALQSLPALSQAAPAASTSDASLAKKQLDAQALKLMATQGYPLTVQSNVAESASVEAVLLPPRIVAHIFGKETAQNYLSIELIVSNHNPQASLIIESLFLDYTAWNIGPPDANDCVSGRPLEADKQGRPVDSGPAQRVNCPRQMASAEYRLVRAEVLDHQPFTKRNIIVNAATAAGTLGTAFAFPFSRDVVTGINAWNGGFIPALGTFYPDPTVSQLNHISDLGFQTNKLIPKESSDVVVAFFPIQRLLTKTLARVYRHDPAVFFVPGEMVLDPTYAKLMKKLVKARFPTQNIENLVQDYEACVEFDNTLRQSSDGSALPPSCRFYQFLNNIALTKIRIGIGGDMSVSTQLVPPTITAVRFGDTYKESDPDSNSKFWNTVSATPIAGNILGTYLTGGVPSIVDSSGNAIKNIDIKAAGSGATDTNLPITLAITDCIPPLTTDMYLKVTKQASTDTTTSAASSGATSTTAVTSMPFGLGTYRPDLKCKK